MDIDNLIKNIKTKLIEKSYIQNVVIEDKTFLHLKHATHNKDKFHLKITIFSDELKIINKIDATKRINNILKSEIENYIHSIQILFK